MLNTAQSIALATFNDLAQDGLISGHDLRLALQNKGLGKQELARALGDLVSMGFLQRVKITQADGLFYLAYRAVRGV